MELVNKEKSSLTYKDLIKSNQKAIDNYYDQIFYVLPNRRLNIDGYIKSITSKQPFPDRGIAGVDETDSNHPIHYLKDILKDVERTATENFTIKRKKRKLKRNNKEEIDGVEEISEIDSHQKPKTTENFDLELFSSAIPTVKANTSTFRHEQQSMESPKEFEVLSCPRDEEISTNKLSIEELKKLKRFESYDPGAPSNVLYVKNLSSKVTEKDLVCLFGHHGHDVVFRLMKGRMRGQAFIRFKSLEAAQTAMQATNGLLFKGRPLVLEFGKHSS